MTHRAGFVGYDEGGHFVHYCHCGKWGSHSIGAFVLRGQLGTWYCAEHFVEAKKPKEETMEIPARFRVKCEFCDGELNTQSNGVYQWTAGWVMNRAGGGGHGISLPKREPRWAHGDCVERRAKGHAGQENLFA